MKLPAIFGAIAGPFSRMQFVKQTMQTQFDAIIQITASEGLLGQIAHYLRYKPKTWTLVHPGCEYYEEFLYDIRDVLPNLPHNAVILLNTAYRWTIVQSEGRILPLIFITKGGCTRLYRLVLGDNSVWLLTLYDEVTAFLLSKGRPSQEDDDEPEEDTSHVPKLHRDPKWDAGGFKF